MSVSLELFNYFIILVLRNNILVFFFVFINSSLLNLFSVYVSIILNYSNDYLNPNWK